MLKLRYSASGNNNKYYSRIIRTYQQDAESMTGKHKELLSPALVEIASAQYQIDQEVPIASPLPTKISKKASETGFENTQIVYNLMADK